MRGPGAFNKRGTGKQHIKKGMNAALSLSKGEGLVSNGANQSKNSLMKFRDRTLETRKSAGLKRMHR